jgi:glycosyltransferase involved in cell wall biosynthesis
MPLSDTSMRFSIVIPTYNRAALLGAALDSVLAQHDGDWEIIVVDDGSKDNTVEVAAGYGNKVRLLQQQNRGPGAARNLGAAAAAGDYLVFLDSDDVLFPWSLQKYNEIITSRGKPAFISGKHHRFSQPEELNLISNEPLQTEGFADYFASGDEWRWWGASSFVVDRKAFQSVSGFTNDWINFEDADLAMRLGVSAGFAQVTAPYTFGYREHAVSAVKDKTRTLAGAWHQIRAERAGHYPGGPVRAWERRRILTRLLRPVTLDCLKRGLRNEAWALYRTMFRWHVALGRWKYLAAFPVKALLSQSTSFFPLGNQKKQYLSATAR